MSISKIKKGDQVIVITGNFKGHIGTVIDIITNKKNPKKIVKYAVISGIKSIDKFRKPNIQFNVPGEKLSVSRKINISNIQLLVDGQRSRVKRQFDSKKFKYTRVYTKNNLPVPEPLFEKSVKNTEKSNLEVKNN